MHGNKLSKIGRKGVPECRSRKVYCGCPGGYSYLLDVISILVSEFMTMNIISSLRTLMTYFVAVGCSCFCSHAWWFVD